MTSDRFLAWQGLVFQAAQDPHQALQILQSPPADLTSEQWARGQFWKACLFCQSQQLGEALNALQRVDQVGHWLSPARLQDHDLDPIRDDPEFVALIDKWTQRLGQEAAAHSATLQVLPSVGSEKGTVIALHMNSNSPAQTHPLFSSLITEGWRVAIAGSGQYVGEGMAVWNDRAQAETELQQWAEQLGGAPLWAGLSAGGSTVLRGALNGSIAASGVLAVVPSVAAHPEWYPDEPIGVPVALVVGKQDPLALGTLQFAELLKERGVPVRVWRHAGGHDVPENWQGIRAEALEWIQATKWIGRSKPEQQSG
ncbi:hypothetical protein [Deinococcus sp. QL22]|uniref:hypothetical protein n=1 Tax=Deinococcus sp. QL22 TaxID=2939437 RepID=UPI002016D38D|nr:hypothetical protein [Deinococcus sp. QL22]UQN09641.1 hypothetical protein M1R55_26200 [Deinococcus sp. QL22]